MKDTLDIIREHEGFPTTASKDTLLPCPFCGGQAVMGTTYRNGFFTCTIECDKCYIRTQDITSDILELARQDAIEAWNRRAE